jgi:hypothetical protein
MLFVKSQDQFLAEERAVDASFVWTDTEHGWVRLAAVNTGTQSPIQNSENRKAPKVFS